MTEAIQSIWDIKSTEIPFQFRAWLEHAGSFMQRLEQYQVNDAHIQVLQQKWFTPSAEEKRLLGLKDSSEVLVREVLILSHDRQWMFARTVIPRDTLTGEEQKLAHLENRPLGSILFKDPTMKRSAFDFACIHPGEKWHAQISSLVQSALPALWARRSIFSLHEKSLLLTEVFLPDIATL